MIEVVLAEGEVDALLAFRAYQRMHAEGTVPGSLHPLKTLTHLLRWAKGPGSVVLLAMDGDNVAGVLTLVESGYWYNDAETYLGDRGFYVLPEYRGTDAAKLLLEAAQKISDDAKTPVFITINNGHRKRGGRSEWERTGATLGYVNRGAVLTHTPET